MWQIANPHVITSCGPARAGTLLVKNHKDIAAATADALLLFDTARKYAAALAVILPGVQGNLLYKIATSQLYTVVGCTLFASWPPPLHGHAPGSR